MLHVLHCVVLVTFAREKKEREPLFKQTLKVTFHIITSLWVVFGLSTLISYKRKTRREESVSSTLPREKKLVTAKKAMTRTKIIKANSLHIVESLRRWAACCFPRPVSRMLAKVLEWLTDFVTGAIMESRKAARSKAIASPSWFQ